MRNLVIKNTKSIRQKIYDHLREQLLDGETPPSLASHSLELEGLIESIPRVGYVVKPIKEAEVEEICEIRTTIEWVTAR